MTTAKDWHARAPEEVARELGSDVARGLSAADAARRLAEHGPNELAAKKKRSLLATLAHQFRSLIVALLVAAGGIAFALGDVVEAIAILVVIVLNALIGFLTEWKAASALDALQRQAVPVARVRRDGAETQVDSRTLVPGDVLLLAAGDRVSADARVVEATRLQVDEAALTGESVPVAKATEAVPAGDAPLADRASMVHLGTVVTDGRGVALVTATGSTTEIGRIGTLIENAEARRAPLEAKLAGLSRALLLVVLALCAVIVVSGWLRGNELLQMVEVGISLAIAAVPEGLLAVTTMTLAIGMQRMARMNALVRRLPAVETLGSTTVICSDKTGTLTRNEMTVRVMEVGGRRFAVGGTGYDPAGEFTEGERAVDAAKEASLLLALRIGALCNDAKVDRSEATKVLGDPTEAALIVAAAKAGLTQEALQREFPREREIPFDSESKRMVTVHRAPGGGALVCVKGSPAAVLEASTTVIGGDGKPAPLDDAGRKRIRDSNDELAAKGLRILGLALRELPAGPIADQALVQDLTMVGLSAMEDPLRDGVRDTIATCREAGIRTMMITGDQQVTAAGIAKQLGMDTGPDGQPLKVAHARELTGLDEAGWDRVVRDTAVFARVSPEHKLRIVEALQRQQQIVAMTGDGVNDAPALKAADIGIAMGIRGTDVAKEASDMVITDDDFTTIVRAIEQGRVIVNNILRFIHYLFSCNFAEIVTVFAAIMIGWPLPLGVMQILWLNIITDIFPALALALEPSAPGVMKRPPRDPEQPILTARFGWLIAWQGIVLAACTLAAFRVGLAWHGDDGEGLRTAVTMAFMALALAQVAHAFNCKSATQSMFSRRLLANRWLLAATATCVGLQLAALHFPFLREVLHTSPLALADWGVVIAAALAPLAIVELVKAVLRTRSATAIV